MGSSPVREALPWVCPRAQAGKEHVSKQEPLSSNVKEHVLGLTGQVSKDSHKIIKSVTWEVGRRSQLKRSY